MPNPSKRQTVNIFIPGIAWFFLLLVLICLPGSKIPPVETWLNDIYFDKWVHTGLFAVLVFLFIHAVFRLQIPMAAKKNLATKIALASIVWALTTEFIQKFFIPGRSFDGYDVFADALGILIAYTWCRVKYF